ncbi:MAG TPA: hypothetical protein VM096_06825 [Vicinamibacterales bacterium]|nr:hypothetical protein [Vicinamibacterales bacterium]
MRLALATLWIMVGCALTAAAYWAFLITPESTVWALIMSAILAVVALALAGFTATGAIAMWWHGASMSGVKRAWRSIHGVIPAAAIVWAIWWVTRRVEMWIAMRNGEINAWFIARFGWGDMSWLFTGIGVAAGWFRWVIAALLALSLLAGFVAIGWPALRQSAWLRRALRPRAIAAATLWFVGLIALPWMYLVPWRPQGLPPTSIEFAFIVAKLSISAILFALGAALITYEASRLPPAPVIAA